MTPRFLIRRAGLAAAALCMTLSALPAVAQQPLRILVGFPAGGSTDSVARVLAEGMARELQRPVVVENRPGAGGQIAANALKQASPDGNTLFLSNSHALSMIPLTVREPGYETLKDFSAVGLVAISPDVLGVNPKVVGDVNDLAGLIAWAKANPTAANVGVPAPASDPEFGVRLLGKAFDVELTPVPYRGDGPVLQDLIAGQIPAGIGSIGVMLPYVKEGRVKIIAISGPERLTSLPDVPTYVEQGLPNYGTSGFAAVLAPAGTPQDLINRYNEVITRVVESPAFGERVSALGIVPATSTPEALTERIRATNDAFAGMVEQVGFQIP